MRPRGRLAVSELSKVLGGCCGAAANVAATRPAVELCTGVWKSDGSCGVSACLRGMDLLRGGWKLDGGWKLACEWWVEEAGHWMVAAVCNLGGSRVS